MICPHCGHAIVEDQLLLEPQVPKTPKVRSTDPGTSRIAALRNEPRAGTQRARLLQSFRAAGARGLTADEAAAQTGLPYVSVSTRLSELKAGGHLTPAGVTRPTANGGDADVLIAVGASTATAAAA